MRQFRSNEKLTHPARIEAEPLQFSFTSRRTNAYCTRSVKQSGIALHWRTHRPPTLPLDGWAPRATSVASMRTDMCSSPIDPSRKHQIKESTALRLSPKCCCPSIPPSVGAGVIGRPDDRFDKMSIANVVVCSPLDREEIGSGSACSRT